MSVVDARLRVRHPCPYCDLSAEFPGTLLLLWCDNRRDTFLVSSPEPGELRHVLAALRGAFRARLIVTDGCDAILTIPEFEWREPPSVTGLARRSSVWVLHPVVYYEGTETYRLVAPTKLELHRLVRRIRRIGDVELLSVSDRAVLAEIRDVPVASVHFFEGLTERQARSMIAAFEGGLLDVPARARWNDIARREGLSRSTFGEHLRKGQLRLLANSYAALKSRIAPIEPPVIFPAAPTVPRTRRLPMAGFRAPSRRGRDRSN